jgi:hypothetical protein
MRRPLPIPLKTRSENSARGIPRAPDARHFRRGRCEVSCVGRVSGDPRATARRLSRRACSKFLRIRHVRKIERLASLRQRDPRIAQAFIMFALLGVVFFLRQRCAPGRRFPCGLALGSHVVLFHFLTSTFFPRRGHPSAMAANLWPPPSPSNRRNCGYRMPSSGSSWIDQFLRLASRLIPANEARAPLLYAHCPLG